MTDPDPATTALHIMDGTEEDGYRQILRDTGYLVHQNLVGAPWQWGRTGAMYLYDFACGYTRDLNASTENFWVAELET